MLKIIKPLLMLLVSANLIACSDAWNSPHLSENDNEIIYQSNFQLPPQHLDPAISYSADESLIIDQIYEQPLGYHFLKRPYELEPLLVTQLPEIEFLDDQQRPTTNQNTSTAFTRYTFTLKRGTRYQPHPAFSQTEDGQYRYLFNTSDQSTPFKRLSDFPENATRELIADDFLYQIKRMADPKNRAPLIGFLSQYIVGMSGLTEELRAVPRNGWLDLRQYSMTGLKKLNDYQYTITIKGVYPQFIYWQAMHFFSPVPWEADRFYHNPGFSEKNLTMDWYPIGTGAFLLTKNDPNSQIILEKNPNYRDVFFPSEGAPGDMEAGILADAGKKLPMIHKAIFSLDKESLPMWSKFLQGYYDRSGEGHGNVVQNFDQTLIIGPNGLELSKEMSERNISLSEEVQPSIYYNGFNMLDPVVGGYEEQQQKLRQAIAIAWDMEESIDIFQNGAGLPYMGPLPPGIDGAGDRQSAINPYSHNWIDGKAVRKPIEIARQLMTEAGYPGGRDSKTGKPLKLYYDVQSQASGNSLQDWQKRQFEKLGIQLEFRATDWNRYKEKIRNGNHQLFQFGWLADYPDPENFLFLLYGPQSPVDCQCDGNNAANYKNPEYDRLFGQMRTMPLGKDRRLLIGQMLELVRRDTPWFSGYYKKDYYLNHQWVYNNKRHGISNANLKYIRIDPQLRAQKQLEWNQPKLWPLASIILMAALLLCAAIYAYSKRQRLKIHQQIIYQGSVTR